MLRQVEVDADLTVGQLQARLRGIESRVGEVADIVAGTALEDPETPVTIVTANRSSDVATNSLHLIGEGENPPDNASLQIAGTAWIEGTKAVVKVFR